ncbi:chorismate-binding protein [Cellulomonas hominis]|uniref:anthranilate synthase family protein n=1 Tax=Cellulomonas hominis TaxID=156981 RepID=UPI001C11BB76|nr:chorismate-binding protein [Cellulomonas hominis]MBU5424238.1 chorismate-binding protein [Cellulomonas hominis]
MTTLLDSLLTDDSTPFAVLRREGSPVLDVLTGDVADVDRLADIPLDGGTVLALVPFRQVHERGFAAHDDGAPLRCLRVRHHERVPLADALAVLPPVPVPLEAHGFDVDDATYAERVRTVVDDEIGRGEGANFVLRRDFVATTTAASGTAVLGWLRALLEQEQGSYWTFALRTPGLAAAGATPERHVSVAGGVARMNPISGTFRHGERPPTGAELLAFLADGKESDELFMVVDEEMKMMSAVCPDGGRILGPYLKQMSRLTHTEYVLEGRTDLDVREVLRLTMFAPTVTGSPMGNACAVIARHETTPRGYYSGVLALFEPDGDRYALDAPILIRTAYLDDAGRVTVPVGATLVRHSTAAGEVAETHAKAAGVLTALGVLPRAASGDGPAPRLAEAPGVAAALAARNDRLASFWLRPQGAGAALAGGRTALVVDAEDQFTTMLAHQLRHLGLAARVVPWDAVPADADVDADLLVLGPGPGDPRRAGDPRIARLRALLGRRLATGAPTLAVCLSHQVLALEAGLAVEPLPAPRQGLRLEVDVFGEPAAIGFYNTFAARVAPGTVRTPRHRLAVSADATGVVHALRGPGVASVQGHLESVLSSDGLATLDRLVTPLLG